MSLKKYQKKRNTKNFYLKGIIFIFSVFLLALNYNLFLVPNDFVIGGTSGLAIIIQKLYGLDTVLFITITSVILMIFSFFFLGWKETNRAITGAILYPFLISLTKPLSTHLLKYLEFDSILIVAFIGGCICGIANGLIYKTGYTTGGSDILMKIVNKYGRIPEGKAVFTINIVIMLFSSIVFGATQFIYSLLVLYVNTTMIDRIMTGISNSKLFFIYTKEEEKIKSFIMNNLKTGVTILNATGGFSKEKISVLMCVVPNKDYYLFKEKVLEIDKNAFFVINDCYEVEGGIRNERKIIRKV